MNRFFLVAVLSILYIWQADVFAQEYIYKNFTTADGLPSSEVYHVFQDSRGYIWFATDNGVSRYNGYEFQNFDVNDGLATNSTSEIYEDYKGRVWFIGMNRKLSYYTNNEIVKFKYNTKLSSLFNRGEVPLKSSFYIDSLDNIYISIIRHGIYKINKEGYIKRFHELYHKIEFYTQFRDKIISAYYLRSLEDVKIEIFNDSISVKLTKEINEQILSSSHVFAVRNNNKLLISLGKEIYQLDGTSIKLVKRTDKFIQYLYKDKDDGIWICYRNGGAEILQKKTDFYGSNEIFFKQYNVSAVLKDKRNGIWFSTTNNGVYYLPSKIIKRYNKGNISGVSHCKNSIYLTYKSNIVSELSFENYSFNTRTFPNDIITCVLHDSLRHLTYFGSSRWTYLLDNRGKVRIIKNNHQKVDNVNIGHTYFNLNSMLLDKNTLWIIGGTGFFKLQNNKVKFDSRLDKNFMMRVNAICKVDSSIYLGTEKGLWKFENNKLNSFSNINELLGTRILDIKRKNNSLVLATKGGGILLKNGSVVKQITKGNGLNNNTINCLLIEDSVLWSGSVNGLNKTILKDKMGELVFENTTSIPELSEFEIRQMLLIHKKLYLATNKGIIEFNKDSINQFMKDVPLYITTIKTNDKQKPITQNLIFAHDENNLQINYEALYYKRPDALKYRYKLIGLDKDWVYTKERQARYYYLDPGKYKFVVEVQDENMNWIRSSAKIDFKIIPAFYQTTSFKIAASLFFLSILSLLVRARQKSNRYKLILKQNVYNYMNQAMKAQIHPHFIFNTLNSINKYILLNNKKEASMYLTKFSKLIRKVLEHSQNESITLAEELYALELYLSIEALRLKGKFTYSINIDDDLDPVAIKLPSLLLQPFLRIPFGMESSP
jgi:ligand-binding sensor domain-containing protein